jgi:hypothetical protein
VVTCDAVQAVVQDITPHSLVYASTHQPNSIDTNYELHSTSDSDSPPHLRLPSLGVCLPALCCRVPAVLPKLCTLIKAPGLPMPENVMPLSFIAGGTLMPHQFCNGTVLNPRQPLTYMKAPDGAVNYFRRASAADSLLMMSLLSWGCGCCCSQQLVPATHT